MRERALLGRSGPTMEDDELIGFQIGHGASLALVRPCSGKSIRSATDASSGT